MPRRDGPLVQLESLTLDERRLVDDGTHQLHWYALAAGLAVEAGCRNALDVGTGWGLGLDVLRKAGLACCGLDPLPLRPGVLPWGVDSVVSDSYDMVVACDVLEHVEDDVGLLQHMLRVARRMVFVSTPNWLSSRCRNPHHVREYTPDELLGLLDASGCSGWTGWSSGPEREPRPIATLAEARHNFGVWLRVHPRPAPV